MIRILFAFLFSAAAAQNTATVRDCSAPGSLFHVDKLMFEPSVPIAGKDGKLTVSYTAPVDVNSGFARYTCSLNGLPVYDEQFDLCGQTVCPIVAGAHIETSSASVPAASGKINCAISWTDAQSAPLMCVEMLFKLSA